MFSDCLVFQLQCNLDLTKCQGAGEIGFLYRGFVISRFCGIHFTVTLARRIICYTEDFVIERFVKSRFHCTCSN